MKILTLGMAILFAAHADVGSALTKHYSHVAKYASNGNVSRQHAYFDIPQFDPAFGTLTSISYRVKGQFRESARWNARSIPSSDQGFIAIYEGYRGFLWDVISTEKAYDRTGYEAPAKYLCCNASIKAGSFGSIAKSGKFVLSGQANPDGFGEYIGTGQIKSYYEDDFFLYLEYDFHEPTAIASVAGSTTYNFDIYYNYRKNAAPTKLVSAIAGVPEPSAWFTMIIGFGLSGVLLRGRRSANAS